MTKFRLMMSRHDRPRLIMTTLACHRSTTMEWSTMTLITSGMPLATKSTKDRAIVRQGSTRSTTTPLPRDKPKPYRNRNPTSCHPEAENNPSACHAPASPVTSPCPPLVTDITRRSLALACSAQRSNISSLISSNEAL